MRFSISVARTLWRFLSWRSSHRPNDYLDGGRQRQHQDDIQKLWPNETLPAGVDRVIGDESRGQCRGESWLT
jgi:hypothetical protein